MPPATDVQPQPQRRRSGLDYETGCDFFCLRFQVWYPSEDCAVRTRFQTYPGCAQCDQGRFNLKRHAGSLQGPPALLIRGSDEG